jgi:hypothetical protein
MLKQQCYISHTPPSFLFSDNLAIVASVTAEKDNTDDGEAPGNDNAGRPTAATKNIQGLCCCHASADRAVTWIAVSWEDKTLSLYSAKPTSSSNWRERNNEMVEEGRIQPPVTYLMPRCARCLPFVTMPSLLLLSSSSNNSNRIQLIVIAGNFGGDNVWAFLMPSIAADAAIVRLYSSTPPQQQLLLGHTASILTGLSNAPCYRDKDGCGWRRH